MTEYEVTSATKPHRLSTHEHITEIGNNIGSPCWRMSREKAIAWIDCNLARFYTLDRTTGLRVYIRVVREPGKLPYLRTQADGKWKDNLLALPDCYSFCAVA